MKTYTLGTSQYAFQVNSDDQVGPMEILSAATEQNRQIVAKMGRLGEEATPFNREPVALAVFMLTAQAVAERDSRIAALEGRIVDLEETVKGLAGLVGDIATDEAEYRAEHARESETRRATRSTLELVDEDEPLISP